MSLGSIKDGYRQEILRLSPYIKVSAICRAVGISNSSMYYFLNKNRDELLSVNKLQKFMDFLDSNIKN